ncbi:MAG: hypothetical protein HY652_05335 [Acidobacteria bacterium]|nr:hypothetical protein [Acidobacteriota bacterium]
MKRIFDVRRVMARTIVSLCLGGTGLFLFRTPLESRVQDEPVPKTRLAFLVTGHLMGNLEPCG